MQTPYNQAMVRFLIVLAVVVVAFTIYALIDLIMTEKQRVRALNKPLWAVLIIVLPIVGGVLWLTLGKSRRGPSGPARKLAPDDDPEFLYGLTRDQEAEERIRKLEQELADLDDDTPNKE